MNAATQTQARADWASQAVSRQRAFFESGATRSYEFRLQQLKQLKAAMIKYADEVEAALKADIGRPPLEAYVEMSTAMEELNHTLKHLKKWMQPKKVGTPLLAQPGRSRIEYTSQGVVFIMGPYNYPFVLCIQPLIGALAAGNTVIMKPSSLNPQTAKVMEKMAKEFFSPDLFQIFLGSTEVTDALLEEQFDHIFFTGSPRVGKIVMAKAAKYLTPVTLELGGKSPTIVHSDAKLDVAARRILAGKFMNVGQTCIAPDHLFVHASIKDEFERKLVQTLKDFYGNDPQKSPDLGRMINSRHFERVKALIDPAKVLAGGQTDAKELYIAPTLLKNVTLDDAVMKEEIFGPVLPIISYNSLNEVYQHVKKQPSHPLALYLFTESRDVEQEVLANIQFGGGCVNNTLMHIANANLPFGGVGESGMGAYHGHRSFLTFSHQRSVLKSTTLFDPPMRYAPYKDKVKIFKFLFK
ncbi:MAG: aldehyde dehydrogenase [Gammaproteobacteria bacterium]|nr:aldehyde dehydrogenase [Gammaproteobacteria bacterium]